LGGEIAADHLINKGAKHVAFVGVDNAHVGQDEQFAGFRNRIIERGGSIDYESYVPLGDVFGYNESKKSLPRPRLTVFSSAVMSSPLVPSEFSVKLGWEFPSSATATCQHPEY
jgi:DNA-binding LacI/PurR family transcriptional regulator